MSARWKTKKGKLIHYHAVEKHHKCVFFFCLFNQTCVSVVCRPCALYDIHPNLLLSAGTCSFSKIWHHSHTKNVIVFAVYVHRNIIFRSHASLSIMAKVLRPCQRNNIACSHTNTSARLQCQNCVELQSNE